MKRTLLIAFATVFFFSGLIGFPMVVPVTPVLAQWGDVVVLDGLQLPRRHQYEVYDPTTGSYGIVSLDTVPRQVRLGTWIYDRTAGTWVSHPSVGQPNPVYVASDRDARREREQRGDVVLDDGLLLPRTHRYELYVPATATYGSVTIDAVASYVRQGAFIYDRTADAWVSHPSVGQPNPQYVAAGRDARSEREQRTDVMVHDGLLLPRSHRYELYVPANGSYGSVTIDTVPGYVRQGAWIYDRTADAWVSHPSVGQPNPQYVASGRDSQYAAVGRDSRPAELLGQLEVDFRADSDVLEVGRDEGSFRKIRIVVRGAPMQLQDMKVIFNDGSVFDAVVPRAVLQEDTAYVFDLPGQRRIIQRISFQYRSVDRREGKATVQVYGEH